jgi:capsular polysaccharide biosynthesis protein
MGRIEPKDLDLERECMRAVGSLTARARVIMIEKRLRHLVKLRDQEVPSLLATRDPMIRVETIERLPPGKFVSGATVVSHASSTAITSLDTAIDVPAMSVRHYTGALTLGGNSLLHTPNSVLPDSFRFAYAPDPTNPQLRNFSRRIVRARASARPTECLVGDFYHVDPQYSGHFGHIMTELVTRLWGWDSAKERIPTLKAVFRRKPGADATLERTLLSAYGIADQDIVCIERPVYVRSVVSATMMWHNWPPYFVHPEIAGVWRRIADALIDVRVPRHEKIFVSRSSRVNRRRCVNAEEVEEFFARRGFVIVYPELLGLNEQAAVFAGARTIAGFGGSAMFNLMYAQRVETVILLYHEAYTARNEHFYALVLGCDIHYFWSTPELQQPESGWSGLAYESEWKFDFPRNGASLAEVLDSI